MSLSLIAANNGSGGSGTMYPARCPSNLFSVNRITMIGIEYPGHLPMSGGSVGEGYLRGWHLWVSTISRIR